MPDILHWLGIKKIDRMMSMSNMKYDAIVNQGIPIYERVPIPDGMFSAPHLLPKIPNTNISCFSEMIPDDSRVEIDAKINAGYFTLGKTATTDELKNIKGRGWESWEDAVH